MIKLVALAYKLEHYELEPGQPVAITAPVKALLVCLAFHADQRCECFPSIPLIQRETAMGRSSIFRSLSVLEAAGLVRREIRLGRSTVYVVLRDLYLRSEALPHDPGLFDAKRPSSTIENPLSYLYGSHSGTPPSQSGTPPSQSGTPPVPQRDPSLVGGPTAGPPGGFGDDIDWGRIRDRLRVTMNTAAFETWVHPMRAISRGRTEWEVAVPNPFFEAWAGRNHRMFTDAAKDLKIRPSRFRFIAAGGDA